MGISKRELAKLIGKDEMKKIMGKDKRNQPGIVQQERPKFPYIFFLPEFNLKGQAIMKQHWSIVDRYKKDCVMAFCCAGLYHIKPAKDKMKVVFTRLRKPGGKPMDDDNLKYSFKYLRDQLEVHNWLFSDAPSWIEASEVDRKPEDKEQWGVMITISEA